MVMPDRRRRRSGTRPETVDDPARRAPVAVVERDGQAIAISPPCEAPRGPRRTAPPVAAAEPRLGFLPLRWPPPLYEVEATPWGREAALPAGLEPVVLGLLERAGIAVVRTPEP